MPRPSIATVIEWDVNRAGDMPVKRRAKDTVVQATWRKAARHESIRIEIQRSTFTLVEERGGLCNFVFSGPAFRMFLNTIRAESPALLDRETRSVVTQWRVLVSIGIFVHCRPLVMVYIVGS